MAGNPALARTAEDGSRFYPWRGDRFWSVTTLIQGGVAKYGLAPWYAKMVAELVERDLKARGIHSRAHAALRAWARAGRADVIARQSRGELTSIKLDKLTDVDLMLRWLKSEPDRVRDTAAALGTEVHSEAEAQVLRLVTESGEALMEADPLPEWPAHLAGQERSFKDFLADWRPQYLATEATVFNRPQAYAGTLDAILQLRAGDLIEAFERVGDPIPAWLDIPNPNHLLTGVVDTKSGGSVYPEVGMQDAAYARAEFIGLPDGVTEVPMPTGIAFGAVLHVTPKGYKLRPVEIGDAVYQAFLFAREGFRWHHEIAPTVLGKDLAPKREKVAA